MKDKQIFVDTNILVYAFDKEAGEKRNIAKNKIEYLWNRSLPPAISVQVLQELYVNLIKKNVSAEDSKKTVSDYLHWNVINNDTTLLLEGIHLRDRWQISFWDALILAAAKYAKAGILWSENFSTAQNYDGITVINPLAKKV